MAESEQELLEELATLRHAAELNRKDAERYKWLKNNHWPDLVMTGVSVAQGIKWNDYLDKAIDAQIQKTRR